jgi:hypothetical protein
VDDLFITVAGWVILLLSVLAGYCTYKWRRWTNHYRSKTIYYLYRSALVKFLTTIPLTGLAAYRIVAGPTAPPVPYGGVILVVCIITLIGNLSLTTFSFRELDKFVEGDEDSQNPDRYKVETTNEKEDRTFGEARRRLEVKHLEDQDEDKV